MLGYINTFQVDNLLYLDTTYCIQDTTSMQSQSYLKKNFKEIFKELLVKYVFIKVTINGKILAP